MNVLVLNCGSSSIKYQLLNMDAVPVVLAKGIVEKIGLTYGSFTYKPEGKDKVVAEQPIMDHSVGMDLILKALVHPDHGVLKSLNEIDAVGHRVAHGGLKKLSFMVFLTNIMKNTESEDMASTVLPINL